MDGCRALVGSTILAGGATGSLSWVRLLRRLVVCFVALVLLLVRGLARLVGSLPVACAAASISLAERVPLAERVDVLVGACFQARVFGRRLTTSGRGHGGASSVLRLVAVRLGARSCGLPGRLSVSMARQTPGP